MKKRTRKNNHRSAKSHIHVEVKSKFGIRVAHHRHTGRKVPISYTSYAVLFFILALVGATLLLVGASAKAGPPQTYSGDINVSGIVPGDPPSTPAEITEPKNGTYVQNSSLTIRGTCEPQELGRAIEIYRISAFAGSTVCTPAGEFEITITLLPGKNDIVARTVDWVGQYGPDSATIYIFYDVPVPPGNDNATVKPRPAPLQLFTVDHIFRGVNRNKEHIFEYQIKGGVPPYAVTVDWDDETRSDVDLLNDDGKHTFTHRYRKAGLHGVTLGATDRYGSKAVFQFIVVVNETAAPTPYAAVASTEVCAGAPNSVECYVTSRVAQIVDKLWPAFIVATLMTFSFWLGEKVVYLRYFHHKHRRKHA
jgi:hypothetical protein